MTTSGLLAYDTGQTDALGDVSQYAAVVTQSWEEPDHATTPETTQLAYMNALVAGDDGWGRFAETPHDPSDSFGLCKDYVLAYHPEYLLRDASGNFLRTADFHGMYVPNPANDAASLTWARFVYERLHLLGFDGVWIDDANLYPGHGLEGRITWTDAQYGAYVTRWVCKIGDYFRRRKMQVWVNLGCSPWEDWQRAHAVEIAGHVTGISREHWCRYGDIAGPFGALFSNQAGDTPPVATMLDYAADIQAAGARIAGVDYGHTPADDADAVAMVYGRALFLLAWDGKPGSFYAYRPAGVVDAATDPRWMADIGTPITPATLDVDGVYWRYFTGGIVWLDPHPGAQTAGIVPA